MMWQRSESSKLLVRIEFLDECLDVRVREVRNVDQAHIRLLQQISEFSLEEIVSRSQHYHRWHLHSGQSLYEFPKLVSHEIGVVHH